MCLAEDCLTYFMRRKKMKFKKVSLQDKHKRYLERLLPLREGAEKPFEHRYYLCGNYGLVGTPYPNPVTREEAEKKLASGHLLSSWGYVHEKSTWDDGIRRCVSSYTKLLTTPEDFDKIEQQMEKHYGQSAVPESVLNEDIASVRQNFPSISDEDFYRVIRLDPTFNPDRDSVGTYGKWLLNLFKKGNLDNEGHATDVLKRFEQEKKNLNNKDIGQFKSLEEIDAYLNDDENYKSLSHRQEVRQRQKDRHEVDLSKEATIVGKTAEWTIWMPKTYAASCKLGEGTKWCTASTESDHYYKEYTDAGYLYIIIDNKDPDNKFQIHFESESFMDADDFEVDTLHWFLKYPDVYDIFLRMGYDEFEETLNVCKNIIDNDGLFVMSDNSGLSFYPEEVYEFVRKVVVKDGVTSLPSSAFAGCDALEEIEIPSSVTLIGNAAFYGCTALTDVKLPDNIEVINVDAFQYCSQLRSIKLPAGLKRIRNGAFYGCISLKDIELPDGLTQIDSNAFYNCPSLIKLDIPDSVRAIGYGAFGRSGLRDVVFPYRTIVDKNCLIQCDNLATVKCDTKYDAEWLGIKSKWVTINEGVTNPPMRFILTEDIAAVRKNYPKISDEDFDRLIKLDPTYREGSNSVGTYGKWILNLFNKGKLDNEGHVFDILTRFEENKKNLKNKDIGKFKTLEELDDYLNDDDNYKTLSNRQVTRQNQNARRNADLGNEAEKVFDGSNWEVWIPKTYAASCKLGQGSSWCTATTSSEYYYNYYTHQGNLYININKHDDEDKYQFHFETGSFMDINDRPIVLSDFLSENDELHDFYYPLIAKSIGVEIGGADYDLDLDFNGEAFARVLDYWGENFANRDSVSADFIRQILTGDSYDLFYYDGMMTIRDSNDLPYISTPVREELKRLGLVIDDLWAIVDEEAEDDEGNVIPYADEILDAVDQATMDAVIVGTEDEAMSDIEKSMTREDGEGYVFTIDQGSLILSASPETLVDAYLEMSEGEIPDILRDSSSIAADILVERWASTFRCYEPQYGWNGFSDDAFNEALADRLSEITK